jgi:hypothetical protein
VLGTDLSAHVPDRHSAASRRTVTAACGSFPLLAFVLPVVLPLVFPFVFSHQRAV